MRLHVAIMTLLMLPLGCATHDKPAATHAQSRTPHAYVLPVPPPMPRREIAQSTTAPAGEQIELDDQGAKFLLCARIQGGGCESFAQILDRAVCLAGARQQLGEFEIAGGPEFRHATAISSIRRASRVRPAFSYARPR